MEISIFDFFEFLKLIPTKLMINLDKFFKKEQNNIFKQENFSSRNNILILVEKSLTRINCLSACLPEMSMAARQR